MNASGDRCHVIANPMDSLVVEMVLTFVWVMITILMIQANDMQLPPSLIIGLMSAQICIELLLIYIPLAALWRQFLILTGLYFMVKLYAWGYAIKCAYDGKTCIDGHGTWFISTMTTAAVFFTFRALFVFYRFRKRC